MEKRYFYITDEDYNLALKNGISKTTLEARVRKYGWDVDTAITEPTDIKKRHRGIWKEWQHLSKVCYGTFYSRVRGGMSPKDAALTELISHKARHNKVLPFTAAEFEFAATNGIDRKLLLQRYRLGKLTKEECLTKPRMSKSEAAKAGVENRRKLRVANDIWK